MLDGLAVLDLTDHRGEIGPWLLAELGADVIKVEPPGGTSAREAWPMVQGESLQFAAYNIGKRSVTLDPSSAEDRTTLRRLLGEARMVFDSGPPGLLAAFGVDRPTLAGLNPDIISVLVTPFGSDGPRANDPASELTIAALGGPVRIQGSPERPPVKASVPQVWRHTGAEAALAALIAHHRSAPGTESASQVDGPQFIDVSAQSAMTWTMLNAMEAHAIQGHDFERTGATLRLAMTVPLRRACADGYVILVPRGANVGKLVDWMIEDGVVDPSWADEDWATYDHRLIDGQELAIDHAAVIDACDRLCLPYTKRELLEQGSALGATIAPVNNVADLRAFDHLEARSFWRTLEIDSEDTVLGLFGDIEDEVRIPGSYLTVDGKRPTGDRPPGLPVDSSASFPDRPAGTGAVPAVPDFWIGSTGSLPLEGLKVADFSWVGVGPITGKALADHGATVVRVESINRPDPLRSQLPFRDGEAGTNRSHFHGTFNTSKLGLSIDLKNEGGIQVAKRLVEWADVVLDSFTPGAMSRLGLGPEEVRAVNPSAITVTTSLLGGGGPFSTMAGYGYHAAAIAGFFDLVGWEEHPPDGPWLAYTDTICPRFITPAILAALDRRARTGEGYHIEAAQLEIALQMLLPELLNYEIDGAVASRMGNRAPDISPQGVYPCAGDDSWIALSITDDEAWDRFRAVLGNPAWSQGAVLGSVDGRRANQNAVDTGIEAWTSQHSEAEAERILREAGIAAGVPQRSSDLLADPQYEHRNFYRTLDHEELGPLPYAGHQYRIDGYNNGPRTAAPTLGQHTFDILTDLLGYEVDDIADIAATGCLE
jgi:crotonobetainyl-CoA:carnitine CoA-transferase CaiB-like acyl-CoA transferase